MLVCTFYAGSRFETVSSLMSHIRLVHANSDGQCNLQGCRRTVKNFGSYRNHVYAYHDTYILMHNIGYNDDMDGGEVSSCELQITGDGDHQPHNHMAEELQRAAAIWLLKTREFHCIPLSVMDSIITDYRFYLIKQ